MSSIWALTWSLSRFVWLCNPSSYLFTLFTLCPINLWPSLGCVGLRPLMHVRQSPARLNPRQSPASPTNACLNPRQSPASPILNHVRQSPASPTDACQAQPHLLMQVRQSPASHTDVPLNPQAPEAQKPMNTIKHSLQAIKACQHKEFSTSHHIKCHFDWKLIGLLHL